MSTRFETRPDEQVQQTPEPARGGWQATVQTLLAIFGAIAVFLGLFILYGPEGQSLGFGGDWSWEVGEISEWWAYGFLAGGGVALLGTLTWVLLGRRSRT